MRGLTPEEVELLRNAAIPTPNPEFIPFTPAEHEANLRLFEQGRIRHDGGMHWIITPAGREALRLWALLSEHFVREAA